MLNKEQLDVVNCTEGFVSVVAGPGSGKTRVLVERTARLIEKGVVQSQILLITFTNKVRKEIIERLKQRFGDNEIQVHTFHSLASYSLQHVGNKSGNLLKILDDNDIHNLLDVSSTIVKGEVPQWKNSIIDLDDFIFNNKYKTSLNLFGFEKSVVDKFMVLKEKFNYLTFDDLLLKFYDKLTSDTDFGKKISKTVSYLMVDECQDLNMEQYSIVETLCSYGLKNVLMVGDLDQSIYAWRNANPDLFFKFYSNSTKFNLISNYRSHPNIIEAAKKLILHNKNRIDVDFVSIKQQKDNGGDVVFMEHKNEAEQAKYVTSIIKKNNLKDVVVLFRMNYQALDLVNEMTLQKVKFTIFNEKEFYQKKEIQLVIAIIKLLEDENDILSEFKVLNNFVTLSDNEKYGFYAVHDNTLSVIDKLHNLLKSPQFQGSRAINDAINVFKIINYNKENNQDDLSTTLAILKSLNFKRIICHDDLEAVSNVNLFLKEFEFSIKNKKPLKDFLLELGSGDASTNRDEESVALMSVHSAKGLEFDSVFIITVNQGVIPHKIAIKADDIEEERRLMYVAITRAKHNLFLNSLEKKPRSIFLSEIDIF